MVTMVTAMPYHRRCGNCAKVELTWLAASEDSVLRALFPEIGSRTTEIWVALITHFFFSWYMLLLGTRKFSVMIIEISYILKWVGRSGSFDYDSSLRSWLGWHCKMCWLHWWVSVSLRRCWSAILICSGCYFHLGYCLIFWVLVMLCTLGYEQSHYRPNTNIRGTTRLYQR